MTLSLDDVRNKRFRMARKSGYEVLEVDEFVDQVEATFEQLIDENENLKKQVAALSAAPGAAKSAADGAPATAMPSPQPAAPQTIVVTTGKEASSAVVRLVEISTEQAERLVNEAAEDANRIREEAHRTAEQLTTDARTRAERIESEARVNAERLQGDALSRAEALDRDIDSRRIEMFGALDRERDELSTAVRQLREFEESYRASFLSQLHDHIDALEQRRAEPPNAPELSTKPEPESAGGESAENPSTVDSDASATAGGELDGDRQPTAETTSADAGRTSHTPRLDALLGDQH